MNRWIQLTTLGVALAIPGLALAEGFTPRTCERVRKRCGPRTSAPMGMIPSDGERCLPKRKRRKRRRRKVRKVRKVRCLPTRKRRKRRRKERKVRCLPNVILASANHDDGFDGGDGTDGIERCFPRVRLRKRRCVVRVLRRCFPKVLPAVADGQVDGVDGVFRRCRPRIKKLPCRPVIRVRRRCRRRKIPKRPCRIPPLTVVDGARRCLPPTHGGGYGDFVETDGGMDGDAVCEPKAVPEPGTWALLCLGGLALLGGTRRRGASLEDAER